MTKKEIVSLFVDSKNGDRDAQRKIVDLAKEACHPLVLSFYYNVKKLGINYSDLDNMIIDALALVYEKVDVNKIYDFVNLIKYYYIKTIQSEIRYLTTDKRRGDFADISLDDENYPAELVFSRSGEYTENNDVKKLVHNAEIYNDAIIENNAKLTENEREILIDFFEGRSVREISKHVGLKIPTVYKYIKKGLIKVEIYISTNYPEIYKIYKKG